MLDGYYYCLNCHSEITPDYNEHCTFCGCSAIAVSSDYSNEEVERAFDLLNKEQQGLVIVPPCKVGDRIYSIFTSNGKTLKNYIETHGDRVTQIKINRGGYHLKCWWGYFHLSDIGETVFLTREEAEEALQKRGADNV